MNMYERDFIVRHKMAQYLFEAAEYRLARPEREDDETTVEPGWSPGRLVMRQAAALFARSGDPELSA